MASLTPTATPTTNAIDPKAIKVVLFGLPESGKSSLLGALVQAGHTQHQELAGYFTDLSNQLTTLRQRTYEQQPIPPAEMAAYPIRYFSAQRPGAPGVPVVLFDCDGHSATQLLTGQSTPAVSKLVAAVQSADAIILTLDASASHEQQEVEFREFQRFIDIIESHRAQRHDVGGLPVFLVLTKCDTLARNPITKATWESRIEAKKREVGDRFQEYLSTEGDWGFGHLDLQVIATSIRKPKLTDDPTADDEPHGVATLFRGAIADAQGLRERASSSANRLNWTLGGAGGLLAAMVAAGALFFANPHELENVPGLSVKVEQIRAAESQAGSLRFANIDKRLKELQEIKASSDFSRLPGADQNYVELRIEEAQAYIKFRDELLNITPPNRASSLRQLDEIESKLNKLTIPTGYQAEWASSEVVQAREKMLTKDIPSLKAAVRSLNDYYFALKNRATTLLVNTKEVSPLWENEASALIGSEAKGLPFSRKDPGRGAAYNFQDAILAQNEWGRVQGQIVQLLDLSNALGLLGDPKGPKAPLAIDPPLPGENLAERAAKKLNALKQYYPNASQWNLDSFPDTIRPEITKRLLRTYTQLILDGQALVAAKANEINQGPEIAANWPRVGDYLTGPVLADYRELTTFVARRIDPRAEDPGQIAGAFLKRSDFDIELREVQVRIPDDLGADRDKPVGDLVITYRSAQGDKVIALKPVGDPRREQQTVVYRYQLESPTTLTYAPGNLLYAELKLVEGKRERQFTWINARTKTYQFDSLSRTPQLHEPKMPPTEGQPAPGVTLTITQGKWPQVPGLLPNLSERK